MEVGTASPIWQSAAYLNGEEIVLSNADFRGVWHVLYFYPLDFTFICPTEIVGFEALMPKFREIGVAIVGASTDSFYSHKAWFSDQSIFPASVSHPVLADTSHGTARAFDVLKADDGVAYRATIIVDDSGIVRSKSVNDLSVGRSPAETLRTVEAFQSGGLCSADWRQGDAFAA